MKKTIALLSLLSVATSGLGAAEFTDGLTAATSRTVVTTENDGRGLVRNPVKTYTTVWTESATTPLVFRVGKQDAVKITPDGALRVANTVLAKEVRVTATPFADYVFESTYRLMPLAQVESAIKRDGRLPNMPSAKEIDKDGMPVSVIMVKQMEKIEELTLYMIDVHKKNEALERENAEMKKRLLALEEAIKSKPNSP